MGEGKLVLWANECMALGEGAWFVIGTNANARVAPREALKEIVVTLLLLLPIRELR